MTRPMVVIVISCLGASTAWAEEAPAPGWFWPVGMNLGLALTLPDAEPSFVIGGEVSAAYLFGTAWVGFYGDGLFDTGPSNARLGAGVEAGWFVLGAEAGYVASVGDETHHGLRLGALLSGGLLSSYTRWSYFPASSAQILEIGALLKWPF